MSKAKLALGKVFLSHASPDKEFVQRLDGAIKNGGYDTWLDAHELKPGDPLADSVAAAVSEAAAVIVVATEAATRSRWLPYELNIAMGRMIKGECRVIPVVLEPGEVPPLVEGLVYADFRESFDQGLAQVLAALSSEAEQVYRRQQREKRERNFFSDQVEDVIRRVWAGRGFSEIQSELANRTVDLVSLKIPVNASTGEIIGSMADWVKGPYESTQTFRHLGSPFVVINDYGGDREPLGESFWEELEELVDAHGYSPLFPDVAWQLITERPIEFDTAPHPRCSDVRVRQRQRVVTVEVSKKVSDGQLEALLKLVQHAIVDEALEADS